MIIMLAILGLIVGIYFVVLVWGHLATKKVLSDLEKNDNHLKGWEDHQQRPFDDDPDDRRGNSSGAGR
jgi:hypothetical protein